MTTLTVNHKTQERAVACYPVVRQCAGTTDFPHDLRIHAVGDDEYEGLVAELREGPELIFGDATRLRSKWAAAARVLADLEASGASYIDLRIPGRPAAGGLPAETIIPVAPAGTTSTVPPVAGEAAATADPTAPGTLPPAAGTT